MKSDAGLAAMTDSELIASCRNAADEYARLALWEVLCRFKRRHPLAKRMAMQRQPDDADGNECYKVTPIF
jgi:hypothetical protein